MQGNYDIQNLPAATRCVKPKFTVSEPPFFRRDGQMPKQNLKQALAVGKASTERKRRSVLDPESPAGSSQEEMGFLAIKTKSC